VDEYQPTHTEETHTERDNAVVMGRELPMPVYTAVFVALGILTVIEVTLSQVPRGFLTIPIMLVIATTKAGLVIWFYMHLNKDSRVFALTLLIPFFLVVVCTLFLMLIPTGY
jgi:cytochrome c oxidase subunit IV